jgi:cytochrome P450
MDSTDTHFAEETFSYDPLPYYRVLRDKHPAYYIEKYDTFVFSRFEDIREVLSHGDNVFIASEQTLPSPEHLRAVRYPDGISELPLDPLPRGSNLGSPLYEDFRHAQIKPLRPNGVARIEGLVRELAEERLDILLPKKRFDLTRDYGGMVSAAVVCHLYGIPKARARDVLDLVNALTATDPEKGGVNLAKLVEDIVQFLQPYVELRREAGADGSVPSIDGMLNFRLNGRTLTMREVTMQLVSIFVGATETVPKVTAAGLLELSRHTQQLAEIREDLAANVPKAVEEILRICAPAQWFARTAHKPVTVAGQAIRPGQRVMLLFGSAARDEREFEQPDAFIWNRPIARVLSFGFGQHHCVGLHLARLELRVLITTFLQNVARYHFDMDAAVRLPSSFQWGWNSLTVEID